MATIIVRVKTLIGSDAWMLSGYVYVDMTGRDVGRYVVELKRAVSEKVECRRVTLWVWSGQ